MSNWFTRAPVDVPDQGQKRETVIYGPRGEALIVRVPRPVGFRISQPQEPGGVDSVAGSGKPSERPS